MKTKNKILVLVIVILSGMNVKSQQCFDFTLYSSNQLTNLYNSKGFGDTIISQGNIRLIKQDTVNTTDSFTIYDSSTVASTIKELLVDISSLQSQCKELTYIMEMSSNKIIVDNDTITIMPFDTGVFYSPNYTLNYIFVYDTGTSVAGTKITVSGSFNSLIMSWGNSPGISLLHDFCLKSCSSNLALCDDFSVLAKTTYNSSFNDSTLLSIIGGRIPVIKRASYTGLRDIIVVNDTSNLDGFSVDSGIAVYGSGVEFIHSNTNSFVTYTITKSYLSTVNEVFVNGISALSSFGSFPDTNYILPNGITFYFYNGINEISLAFSGNIYNVEFKTLSTPIPYTITNICEDPISLPCNIDPTFRWNRGQNNNAQFHALDINNNYGYHWDYGDGNIDNGHTNQHFYGAPGTYYVCLTITNRSDSSCMDTYCDSVTVVNQPPIFTPDGDGIDDTYLAPCISKIYNRNGVLVRTLSGPSLVWDGKDDSGNLLPRGQYTIICDADNSTTRVTLFR